MTEDDFTNYFIMGCFVCCFCGSLPSKIAALRYFTFITAIINLLLGALLIYQINPIKDKLMKTVPAPEFPDFKLDKDIFGSYCLSLFSAVNQFSVVNVLTEYKNPTQRRVNKVDMESSSLCSGHPSLSWRFTSVWLSEVSTPAVPGAQKSLFCDLHLMMIQRTG